MRWIGCRGVITAVVLATGCTSALAQSPQASEHKQKEWSDAVQLSSFGERPAFSPDGTRVAFVGKSFGDAYEIDLQTRKMRNLTGHAPHQGVLRVQYLSSGDFLITAPRMHTGSESRGTAELWVLDKNLERGLQPLDQRVSEGVAVSRIRDRLAYTLAASSFNPKDPLKARFYTADIAYEGGTPKLVNKREVVPDKPCSGETQDFRDSDRELTVSCYEWPSARYGFGAGAYGINLATQALIRYRDLPGEYNEIEGVAPDGRWSAVECSQRAAGGPNVGLAEVSKNPAPFLNPLDICRLEMEPGGKLTVLFNATEPGATRKANNPVVSPDGKWMAFASSDSRYKEVGTGDGIYLLRVRE
jgi:hypothetical protein